jgi:hypothetical protein
MHEYKVLTERDRVFTGGFDPTKLETPLNEYASEGWRVVAPVPSSSLWKSMKAEILLILERSS